MRHHLFGHPDLAAETVVLSAGLGGTGAFWHPQIETLAAHYRVIAYDHRGTGANRQELPRDYAIGDMAADVLELLDDLGIDRAHFMGHALGGLAGLELALSAPERLASLILVNAWAKADSHTKRCFDARLALLAHAGPEAYVRAQPIFLYPAAWLSANAERIARDDAHGIAHFQGADTLMTRVGALLAFDVADRLGAIATPTLVAAARDDVLVPYTCSEVLAAGIPGAKLCMVAEGGHGFSVTAPAPFNAAILDFLAAQARRN